jgi:3',5'-cyclic AMP phosphodiesterase CpdA
MLLALLCAGQSTRPFFFIQLSDPQFGMYTQDRDFVQETANLEFVVATINRLRPAFVVITGDLVNRAGDKDQIAEYTRVIGKIATTIPVYSVAGNHDVGNDPTRQTLAEYRKNIGADYYTFRSGPMEGIVLDSSLLAHPQNAPDESVKQEQWLTEELDKAKRAGIRVVVFQHHPYCVNDPTEPDEYFNVTKPIRDRYFELFAKYGVSDVFAGHLHRTAECRNANLTIHTSGPVGKPLVDGQSGIRIVAIRNGIVSSKYFPLGLLPETVE